MNDIIEYKGWIIAGVFILFFAVEHLRPAIAANNQQWRRIIKNLLFWPLNIGLSLIIILPISYFVSQHALWVRPNLLLLDILILDLFIYFWHRAMHIVPFLWRFHEVHHLDEHLDTTSAVRFHFGEVFFSVFVRSIVVVIFAVPFSSILIFETLVMVAALFHHSNIKLPQNIDDILSRIIITPNIHWVHHHAIRKDTDSNYGTIFSFWDRIFKTRSATMRFAAMKIGAQGQKDVRFLRLLVKPFVYQIRNKPKH